MTTLALSPGSTEIIRYGETASNLLSQPTGTTGSPPTADGASSCCSPAQCNQ